MRKKSCSDYSITIFWDTISNLRLITRSTAAKKETIDVGGTKYALVKVDMSSASHSFYGERHQPMDRTKSAERFRQKYSAGSHHFIETKA